MANKDSESMGVSDLNRAKSLDAEAHLMWRERGQLLGKAKDEFNTIVRRFRGILTLVEDVHFRDVWGLERLIEMADDIVRNPQYSNSSLFEEVSIVARKQQILDMQMQYALSKGDVPSAARIAIKILVEDEYIIDTVIMNCVTTLNKYYGIKAGDPMQIPNLAKGVKRETRRGAVDSMRQAKNVIFCLDYSGSMAGERIERANKNLLWVYEGKYLLYIAIFVRRDLLTHQSFFGFQNTACIRIMSALCASTMQLMTSFFLILDEKASTKIHTNVF